VFVVRIYILLTGEIMSVWRIMLLRTNIWLCEFLNFGRKVGVVCDSSECLIEISSYGMKI